MEGNTATIKFAICDDNQADIDYLSGLVSTWAKEHHHNIQIQTFLSAEKFLFHYEEEKDYDCLLLDIEMTGMDGVTMAKKIRKEDESVQIVFITGYSAYIAEGYEVAALYYLMKPIDEVKLFQVLDRAKDKIIRNERMLNFELNGEMIRVPIHEIRYIEVIKNYVTFHAKQEITIKTTLSEAYKGLDERFFKIGRSYIVNITYINRVTKTEVYLDKDIILPLPRGMYEPLNRAIIAFT